jgi:hypothetical protein
LILNQNLKKEDDDDIDEDGSPAKKKVIDKVKYLVNNKYLKG